MIEKKSKPNKYEKTQKSGRYIYKNGQYWFEWTISKSTYDREFKVWNKQPEESPAKLKRNANITILFMKEYDNKNEFNGVEKVWFKMNLDYAMRNDVTNNLWFVESDGKLFIKGFVRSRSMCACRIKSEQ